ncbi:MAG: hypothetical protein K0R50_490 [Eubacterium sp.]|nr:hypothetical protein [Eubacterium sp.]
MKSVFDKKNSCYGCSSCTQVCPTEAISFLQDNEGFFYPEIDQSKCIDCGMCRKACPIFKEFKAVEENYPEIHAVWNKDESVRKSSTSGGVFSALARNILSQGGVVFGAVFDDDIKVIHEGVYAPEHLYRLQGSKYTQSLIGECYKEVRSLLKENKKVLFSGTPCQVSGLYAYLGKSNDNLYTCDCVCHGVPSPGVFELYKQHLQKTNKSEIQSFKFRNKLKGWKNYNVSVAFKNGTDVHTNFKEDPYMIGFIKNMYLRPSCHECKYASVQRQADITLADFWGVEKYNPQLDDDKGTSLILANSPKGARLLEACKEELVIHKADLQAAVRENPSLTGPASPNRQRSKFFKHMPETDFEALHKRFLMPPSKAQLLWRKCLRIPGKLIKIVLGKNKQ